MSIGSDIEKAFRDVGSTYLIKRKNTNLISGEYCVYEISTALRVPFDREFVYQASLAYNTQVVEVDILLFDNGDQFLVANKDPESFANSPVEFETKLLKVNVISGEILRPAGNFTDDQYHTAPIWETIERQVGALLIHTEDSRLRSEDFGDISVDRLSLYLSDTLDIQVNDRFQPEEGEYYKVDVIKKRIFPGIYMVELSQDTRE